MTPRRIGRIGDFSLNTKNRPRLLRVVKSEYSSGPLVHWIVANKFLHVYNEIDMDILQNVVNVSPKLWYDRILRDRFKLGTCII